MPATVTVIGRYRVYKGNRTWRVVSTRSGVEISNHADRRLAVAAAERYHEGDLRRQIARELSRPEVD